MSVRFQTISPVDGKILLEREYINGDQLEKTLCKSMQAFQQWRNTPLLKRTEGIAAFVAALMQDKETHARNLTLQMGRPITQTPWELNGFETRAKSLLEQASMALEDIPAPTEMRHFKRFIRREPLGICLVLSPWNYPYLTAVNAIVAALVAGNVVLLKHAEQTPLCAEALTAAAHLAGLPSGVFQHIHASHDQIGALIDDRRIAHVAFTGSYGGGQAVKRAASARFIPMGFELGGNDPAYVREDANLEHAISNLTEGAMFNSGQSCCGIERIYVHRRLYDDFVAGVVKTTQAYQLGDPRDPNTNLGPMVRAEAAAELNIQIDSAVAQGAKALISKSLFPNYGGAYHPPQILINVNSKMTIQQKESFGPVVTISKVDSDQQAIEAMNNSDLGLTAAIWTNSESAALTLGKQLEAGTVFMNRCDYLDPELPWTGVKNSGLGCTLSTLGIQAFTQVKSFHLRTIN